MSDSTSQPHSVANESIAEARIVRRGAWAVWFIPLGALALALWLVGRAWFASGIEIQIVFERGHGIAPGHSIRHRGIVVGEVHEVRLNESGDGVEVRARLRRDAAALARAGSRFWLVRPEIGLSRIAGLETIVGARYMAVKPGRGAMQRRFVGLESPPIVEDRTAGDLELTIELDRRGSVSAGSPVTYRQVQVGVVERVSLASDAGSVEATVLIEAQFAPLICEGTRFWDAGGIEVGVGLKGVTAAVDSAELLLRGGVALATPPAAGRPVRSGARFRAAEKAEASWLAWRPSLVLGRGVLPAGLPEPRPIPLRMNWRTGRIISSDRHRAAWGLPTERGLIAPAWTTRVPEGVRDQSLVFEIGEAITNWPPPAQLFGELALIDAASIPPGVVPFPASRLRRPQALEDCVALAGGTTSALPLSAGRLVDRQSHWLIDPSVPLDESLDGASVVARADGAVIGVLVLRGDGAATVELIPESIATRTGAAEVGS